jgi:hypothetical protein
MWPDVLEERIHSIYPPAVRWFLARLIFYPEDGGYIPPKRRFTFGLHGAITQKMATIEGRYIASVSRRWEPNFSIFRHSAACTATKACSRQVSFWFVNYCLFIITNSGPPSGWILLYIPNGLTTVQRQTRPQVWLTNTYYESVNTAKQTRSGILTAKTMMITIFCDVTLYSTVGTYQPTRNIAEVASCQVRSCRICDGP